MRPDLTNGTRIVEALQEFGFGSLDIVPADFIADKRGTGRTQDIADAEFLERIQERDDPRL